MADNRLQQEFQNVQKEKATLETKLKQVSSEVLRSEGKVREQERNRDRAADALKKEEDKLALLTRERDEQVREKESLEREVAEHDRNLEQMRADIERMQEDAKK